jgi:glutamyl-tRNA synthetase
LRNYLLRLGWSLGDDEIIATQQAIQWFDLDGLGKSPARFDFAKLGNLNGHYIRDASNERLIELVQPRLNLEAGDPRIKRLRAALPDIKPRARTLVELADIARFYVASRPLILDDRAITALDESGRDVLAGLIEPLTVADWNDQALEALVRHYAETINQKLGAVAQPLRFALTGSTNSPPLFAVMRVLGREETLGRINDVLGRKGV